MRRKWLPMAPKMLKGSCCIFSNWLSFKRAFPYSPAPMRSVIWNTTASSTGSVTLSMWLFSMVSPGAKAQILPISPANAVMVPPVISIR